MEYGQKWFFILSNQYLYKYNWRGTEALMLMWEDLRARDKPSEYNP